MMSLIIIHHLSFDKYINEHFIEMIIYEGYFNDKLNDADLTADIEQDNQLDRKQFKFTIKIRTKSSTKTDEQYIREIKACCFPLNSVVTVERTVDPFFIDFKVILDNPAFDIDDLFDFLYMLCNREVCDISYQISDNNSVFDVYSPYRDVFSDIGAFIQFINYMLERQSTEMDLTYQDIIHNKRALAILFQRSQYTMDMKVQGSIRRCLNITDELIKSLNIKTDIDYAHSLNFWIKENFEGYLIEHDMFEEGIDFNENCIDTLKEKFFYVTNKFNWLFISKELIDDRIIILREESFNQKDCKKFKECLTDRFNKAFR